MRVLYSGLACGSSAESNFHLLTTSSKQGVWKGRCADRIDYRNRYEAEVALYETHMLF